MSEVTILNPLPSISRELSSALEPNSEAVRFGPSETPEERTARLKRGDPAPGMIIRLQPSAPSASVVAEAVRILPQLEHALQPAGRQTVFFAAQRMLDKLNGCIANPIGEDALKFRTCLLAEAGEDLPAASWHENVDRKLLKTFRFMPSVAEIVQTLEAETQALRDKIARVRMIAAHSAAPEPEPSRPSPEEIERRRRVLAERRAELAAQEREEAKIREHGSHTPAGAEGLTGLDLAEALKRALPSMTPDLADVTRQRIAMLEQAAAMIAAMESPGNCGKQGEKAGTETEFVA